MQNPHLKTSFSFRFLHINKIKIELNAPSDPAGIGYGGVLILIYSCITYIVILSWSLLYLVFSFSSQLPWATCNNYWNSGKTEPAADIMSFTPFHPLVTEDFSVRVLFFGPEWHKRLEQQDQHNLCCHWILGVCWWANLTSESFQDLDELSSSFSCQTTSVGHLRRHWGDRECTMGSSFVSNGHVGHLLLLYLERGQVNWKGTSKIFKMKMCPFRTLNCF